MRSSQRSFSHLFVSMLVCCVTQAVHAGGVAIEGVKLTDTEVVGDVALDLNGAAVRKQGYFKVSVNSLYLPHRCYEIDCVYRSPGPKRIQIILLRDVPGPMMGKYFINDFKLVASESEFKRLITAIGKLGEVFAQLGSGKMGDVNQVDWIPGKGVCLTVNGIHFASAEGDYLNDPLLFEVLVRMFVGERAPREYRQAMLGFASSDFSSNKAAGKDVNPEN